MPRRRPHYSATRPDNRKGAFSLIELVVVVVIIGLLGAMAALRIGRAAEAAADSAMAGTMMQFRSAIDRYFVEHGAYPTCDAASEDRTTIMLQLTQYTDRAGDCSPVRTATHVHGPYLRKIPVLPATTRKGRSKIDTADAATVGWLYDTTTGEIRPNTAAEADQRGRLYTDY
jgi:prepilin-type N-terminal cleavage/methylation domain-containing protein